MRYDQSANDTQILNSTVGWARTVDSHLLFGDSEKLYGTEQAQTELQQDKLAICSETIWLLVNFSCSVVIQVSGDIAADMKQTF